MKDVEKEYQREIDNLKQQLAAKDKGLLDWVEERIKECRLSKATYPQMAREFDLITMKEVTLQEVKQYLQHKP